MKKTTIKLVCYSFFICCLFSCKAKQVEKKEEKKLITIKKGNNIQKTYNEDKTMVLILNYIVEMPTTFNYRVEEVSTKKILKEGVFVGVKMEWFGNNKLKGTPYVGMVRKDNNEDLLKIKDSKSIEKNYTIIQIN